MKQKILFILVYSTLLVFFLEAGLNRFVTGDEGYYILAAKEILAGKTLYLDFLYTQTPLLPYLYAAWMKIYGISWESARIFSALCSALLGALLFQHLKQKTNLAWALLGTLLFACSVFVYPWYPTAKTYGISVLFLFVSYLFLTRDNNSFWSWIWAGFFIGLAVNVRLFFAALIPLFLIYIVFREKRLTKSALFFLLGGAVTAIPLALFFLFDFQSTWFGNMGYHLIRSGQSAEQALESKGVIFKTVLSLRDTRKFFGFQYAILLFGTAISLLWGISTKNLTFASIIALALFCINFLPTPSYVQYFTTLAPFCVIALILFYSDLMKKVWHSKLTRYFVLLLSLFLLFEYFRVVPADFRKYTQSGYGVLGVRGPADAPNKTLNAMKEIAQMLDKHVPAGQVVLSPWPGILIDSKTKVFPGLENHFGLKVSNKLKPEELERYHIVSEAQIEEMLRSGAVQYVAMSDKGVDRRYSDSLKAGGYKELESAREVTLFTIEPR